MLADLSSLTARNDRRLIATSCVMSVVASAVMGLFALEGKWPDGDRGAIIVLCLVLTLASAGLLCTAYYRWLREDSRLTAASPRDLNTAAESGTVAQDVPEAMVRAATLRPHDPDAALERGLHQALARGEFTLVYQPQIDIRNRVVTGFEALLRWQRLGMAVGPDRFIPIAERCGLIDRIGEWVLHQACATAAGWAQPHMIAVNVSAVQLSGGGLSTLVAQILRETGLAASRLELEITETAMLDDPESALKELCALRTLGVRVAMDDFGCGFSSLATLRAFPFDRIKIDKSFVQNVHGNRHATALLRGMLGLAHGLGLSVVAEGVETWEEVDLLIAEHCAEAQGYLFAKPAGIDTLFDEHGQLKPEAVYLTMGQCETASLLELAYA